MRRLLATLALLACAAVGAAGCDGDESSSGALESALAYVPADTPFAVAVDTDVEGDQYQSLEELLGRFPGGDSVEQLLRQGLEEELRGLSYEEDVRPLLGNPFVVSATDVTSFLAESEDDDFLAAIQVEDTEALDRVVEQTRADELGEVAGATVYDDEGTFFAVEDDMVVFGGTRELLESALERADGGDHLDVDTFESSFDGLPRDALARVYFDVERLVAQDPDTAEARRVEWIAALRTFGMTASVADDSVEVEFNLRTSGEDLTDEDLPLAAGDESPQVVQEAGEIGFALRDPSQVATFFESAFQAVDPQGFGEYQTGKRAISRRFGIDVDDDLFTQLTGDLSVSVAVNGSFAARAEVEDPDAFTRTLAELADALPQLGAGLGVTGVRRQGDLYVARVAGGGRFVFGVIDDVLVAGSNAARARRMASAQPTEVPGASGSLVMAADAERVALQVIEQLGDDLGLGGVFGAGLFARPLDDLTGSVASSTGGMRGSFRLTLD